MSTTYLELRRAVYELVMAEDAVTRARQKHLEAQVKVGAALRAAREQKGLSLRTCAAKLKLSAPYLSDVELGRRGMSDGNLEVLMGIIGPPTMEERFAAIVAASKASLKDDEIKISDPAPVVRGEPT